MKLLYVSTLDHIVHVMLPHLAAARARGWQVEVACKVTRDPAITLAHCDALHDIPFARNPLDPRNLVATAKLRTLIRREKYDIVHCHNPSGGFFGRLAATLQWSPQTWGRKGRPIRVYTAHGFHFHPLGGKLSNFVYRTVEGFAGKHLSDAVLTINQWDFDEAKKLMPPERVHFTHGVGVSTDEFDPAKVSEAERRKIRDEFGIPEDGFLVTCIGEMIPRKGHEHAITALDQDTPESVVLALVGEGKLQDSLRAHAKAWGVEEQIRFPGFRRDVQHILAASDLFIFPSIQEGLPCSVQEALSMEIPVICYSVRGCVDMVDVSCGRVIDWVPSALGLSNALYAIRIKTPEERQEMGRAGRRKMIELYDRPKCVAAWQAIYDKLLARRGRTTGDSGGSE